MTEEKKLAERYVNGIPMLAEEGEGFSRTQMQQAFIAGLKTKTQWHNLRENPNDLPKKDCEVIVLHENGRKHIQKWADGNWVNAIVVPVITWCEIPKYTEE